jgi:hypothetical protein
MSAPVAAAAERGATTFKHSLSMQQTWLAMVPQPVLAVLFLYPLTSLVRPR